MSKCGLLETGDIKGGLKRLEYASGGGTAVLKRRHSSGLF